MKPVAFVRFCFSTICFVVLSHCAIAQDSVFTAKQGLAAAQERAVEEGYYVSHLISIHMIWDEAEGTYNINEDNNKKIWNGLSKTWNYTFFQKQDSSYHTYSVAVNSNNIIVTKVNSPENVDTLPITNGWIDSDGFTKAENGHYSGLTTSGTIIQLSYNTHVFHPDHSSKLSWKIDGDYFFASIDAFSGSIINAGIVSVPESFKNSNINLYPNPSSSNITIQFPEQNFTTIEIRTILGELVTSLKIEEGSDSHSIPIENFPASGQYFLHLKGKTPSVIPVTIYR